MGNGNEPEGGVPMDYVHLLRSSSEVQGAAGTRQFVLAV